MCKSHVLKTTKLLKEVKDLTVWRDIYSRIRRQHSKEINSPQINICMYMHAKSLQSCQTL